MTVVILIVVNPYMLRDPALIPLSRDHQHALALCVVAERVLGSDDSHAAADAQARKIVDKFDSEIARHFEVEERILFPALADFADVRDLISELLDEHSKLIALVDRLRTDANREIIAEFTTMLQAHVRKEERQLFEEAQRLLSRERMDALAFQ